ncbi:hypothetical protein RZN22_19120, partial [Bacillaceae bacterium S4-13-58]
MVKRHKFTPQSCQMAMQLVFLVLFMFVAGFLAASLLKIIPWIPKILNNFIVTATVLVSAYFWFYWFT